MNCVVCGKKLTGRQLKFCSNFCYEKNYRDSRPLKFREYKKDYYRKNEDAIREKSRNYYKSNIEKVSVVNKEWKKKNFGLVANYNEARRTRKRLAPTGLTLKDWNDVIDFFDGKCAYCGSAMEKPRREHFIPLSKNGGFTKDNIVPSCDRCNCKKGNKNPLDWLVTQVHGLVTYVKVIQYFEEKADLL